MKTVLITGRKNVGKSTFINELLMDTGIKYSGIRTTRHFDRGELVGFDIILMEQGQVVSKDKMAVALEDRFKVVYDFNTSKEFLQSLLDKKTDVVVIDELGRFEKNNKDYLNVIDALVESKEIFTIIALKKENLEFNEYLIEKSIHNNDIFFIDLDDIEYIKRKEKKQVISIFIKKANNVIKKRAVILDGIYDMDTFRDLEVLDINMDDVNYYNVGELMKCYGSIFYISKDAKRRKQATDLGLRAIDYKDFRE